MQTNDRIVQLLYRRLKGLPLSVEESQELDTWLARSESNRKVLENLADKEWLKEAKKRYNAPGKDAGLAQLREELFCGTGGYTSIKSKTMDCFCRGSSDCRNNIHYHFPCPNRTVINHPGCTD